MVANSRGWTLIELLLSVLLVGIGLIAVVRPLIASVSQMGHISNRMEVIRLFNEKLWEIQKDAKETGVVSIPARGDWLGHKTVYHYLVKINQNERGMSLKDLHFRITWNESGRTKSLDKSAYVIVPEQKK